VTRVGRLTAVLKLRGDDDASWVTKSVACHHSCIQTPLLCMQVQFQFQELPAEVISSLVNNGSIVPLQNSLVATRLLPPFFLSARLDVESVDYVSKVATCGDNICVADEVQVAGVEPMPSVCAQDCPLVVGSTCPAPGSGDIGDASKV
jgi:hypothetical protein